MVADDNVELRIRRFLQRIEGLSTAIYSNCQGCAAPLQLDQRCARRAISLHQPVGDVDHRLDAQPAQQNRKQRRRGGAVDIIVAEDCDRLAALHRIGQPGGGLVHVLEAGRVGQKVADRRRTVPGKIRLLYAAGQQQLVDEVAAKFIAATPAPAPGLVEQARFNAAGKRAHVSSSARKIWASARDSAGT
jgi:hypothetical protein